MNNTFLLNDFYKIITCKEVGNSIQATIVLNTQHPIFKGHFEQMPVVPGVCQTQIIKEILQQVCQKNLQLAKGDNIKFMGTIIPTQTQQIDLEITHQSIENKYTVDAKIFNENTTFTKFKGDFTTI